MWSLDSGSHSPAVTFLELWGDLWPEIMALHIGLGMQGQGGSTGLDFLES